MMVGTQQSTVSLGSLGPFLRTCRRSRCFGRKVHNCETWNYLPHFASFHSIRKPRKVTQMAPSTAAICCHCEFPINNWMPIQESTHFPIASGSLQVAHSAAVVPWTAAFLELCACGCKARCWTCRNAKKWNYLPNLAFLAFHMKAHFHCGPCRKDFAIPWWWMRLNFFQGWKVMQLAPSTAAIVMIFLI